MTQKFAQLGIAWQVGVPSGWGTYGFNLAVELARKVVEPALFLLSAKMRLTPAQTALLKPFIAKCDEWYATAQRGGMKVDFPMLHALGDGLDFHDALNGAQGRPNVGVPFFESAVIPPKNVKSARAFDRRVIPRLRRSGRSSFPTAYGFFPNPIRMRI